MLSDKNVADSQTKGDTVGRLVRRISHGILSISAIYYWLPDTIPLYNLPKWSALIIPLAIVILIEGWRIKRRMIFFGMRPHEGGAIASYVYAVIGIIAVLLFAPLEIGTACIISMALSDPIAGEVRSITKSAKLSAIITAIAYASIILIIFWLLDLKLIPSLLLTVTLTPIAVISESIQIAGLDDDFSMVFFPAVIGTLVWIFVII